MPNVQQKKMSKGSLVALVFIAAMIGSIFLPINVWFKVAIDAVLVLLFLFIRRGYIYFYRGAMALKKGDYGTKAWSNMEKALKAGVDPERQVMVGSAYIQRGDAKRGVEVLEKVMANPKAGTFGNTAIVTCSMGYWRLNDQEKAIKVLEALRATGYRDDNLSVNLETYLLERKELKKAKAAIDEGRKNNTESNGLMDNRGWYYIQTGNWKKAKEIYDELIDDRNAKFPEAYLHGAQVSIHDGEIEQAIDRLGWGTSKRFVSTCMFDREYLEKLLLGLENPKTRESFAKAMEENHVEVSIGKAFPGFEDACEFDENDAEVIKPKDKPVAALSAASSAQKSDNANEITASDVDENINTEIDDDDREPNTDLDEDDAELASRLGYDSTPDPEDYPDTTLDDDDEREPNTDLDEND